MRNLTLLALLLVTNMCFAQNENQYKCTNYIEVIGKAEMDIVPDIIILDINIYEKDLRNKSLKDKEIEMFKVLKDLGVDISKDLIIKDMFSYKKNKFISKDKIYLQKSYELKLTNAKTANKLFSDLKKIDIYNVFIRKLDNSKIKEYRKQVRINAIKAAKEKATYLTSAIGQKLYNAIHIKELTNNYNHYARHSNVLSKMESSSNSFGNVKLEFKNIKISSSILCKFELR